MAHILIAEHNTTTAHFLTTELKKAGHRVQLVQNAKEAYTTAKENIFDIIMMNVIFPKLDGFYLAQRTLQDHPETQIIFITGFSGIAMDTYATPAYAPAPVTLPSFHLKQINTRVHSLMSHGVLHEIENKAVANSAVIYADFASS